MIDILDVQDRLAELLNDEEFDQWEKPFHLHSINEGLIAINRLLIKTEQFDNAESVEFDLVAGAKQPLPDECDHIVGDVVDNCGNGLLPRTEAQLASFDPCWRNADKVQGLEFYSYDTATNTLWVYPQAEAGDKLTVRCIKKVVPVDETSTEIDLDETYLNDLINFCLYRAYQREGTQTHKEAFYRSAFYEGFGLKVRMDTAVLEKEKAKVNYG